ncbi:glycosyltransferase family 2 protein [Synoicihabitans lomoniglobus]|uniref:Glycosyltransferase family 2 protein n=1 Tax=Synoicihabitans lomoniglobus TaxID=2909285 RepID=A0AAF0I421_9BACT|nr:glycosyltransferase family 2 protein [Opitutaceae bacterium LMO-M01]WED67377.1 glycosyltransferase family 2 protein [Opitutaceae bacterium LMO-M01]
MISSELAIVIPVYNESANIVALLQEWREVLDPLDIDYRILAFNDGSRDDTGRILDEATNTLDRLEVVHKPNTGHGRTCRFGYDRAVSLGFAWILQIDSDGQCDPAYFKEIWNKRVSADCVFGLRVTRDDGWRRALISRLLRFSTFILTGRDLRDANVPYRLMRADVLQRALKRVPANFDIQNVALTLALKRERFVTWSYVPIRFRDRQGGTNSINVAKILKMGWDMLASLHRVS